VGVVVSLIIFALIGLLLTVVLVILPITEARPMVSGSISSISDQVLSMLLVMHLRGVTNHVW